MKKRTREAGTGKIGRAALAVVFAVLLASGTALAASPEDQAQTNTESAVGLDARYPSAQTFTAGRTGLLDGVALHARLFVSRNVGDLILEVQSVDGAGEPSGTVLGSGTIAAEEFTPGAPAEWRELTLERPVAVTGGTRYALVVSSRDTAPDGSFYNWSAAFSDPYAGGDAKMINPSTGRWETRRDNGVAMDFAFRTRVASEGGPGAPTVMATDPAAKAKGVARGASITAAFSRPMDRTTLTKRTVTLHEAATGRRVRATVACAGGPSEPCERVVLDPFGEEEGRLGRETRYRVTISSGANDTSGGPLDANPTRAGAQDKTWTFTTGRR